MSIRKGRVLRGKSPATRRGALERNALLSARALVDRMRAIYRELERMTDAPITVHRALVCIGDHRGLPASQLAKRLGMQRPAVSHVLKSLAARGWIDRLRNEADHRSVQIHPTPAGQQILRSTAGRAVGTLQRAVHGLSLQELQQLAAGLAALLARLPEPAAPRVPSAANGVPRRVATLRPARITGRP